jgi:hypothetical protein
LSAFQKDRLLGRIPSGFVDLGSWRPGVDAIKRRWLDSVCRLPWRLKFKAVRGLGV